MGQEKRLFRTKRTGIGAAGKHNKKAEKGLNLSGSFEELGGNSSERA